MSQPTNLDELIDAATREASRMQAQEQVAIGKLRQPRRLPLSQAFLAVLLAMFAWGVYAFWAPLQVSQVERDLGVAIDQARQAVEASRGPGGALPSALPNAALSRVVAYQPEPGGYRLEASMMGVRISLERDGNKRIEKESSQ